MSDKKPRRSAQGEPETLEQAYLNDAYWLKYLDGQDCEAVQIGEETTQQTRDRRNQHAIMGAYRDALETRSEEEALAFVLDAVEQVKKDRRFAAWVEAHKASGTEEEKAQHPDDWDIPF